MKKILFFLCAVFVCVSAANAGILDALGLSKKAEPQTLAEACDTDEIKKICPEVLIGSKSMTECLIENVKSLSKQCANFVKKSVTQKVSGMKSKESDDDTITATVQQFGSSLKSLL